MIVDGPGDGGTGGGTGGTIIGTGGTPVTTGQGGTTLVCPDYLTNCNNNYCADLTSDPTNCGACGAICADGAICEQGSCVFPPDCVTCGQFITDGTGELCGTSAGLYNALVDCVCAGKCVYQCSDNICGGQQASDACINCIQDTVQGCGNEFNECANDF